MPGAWGCVSKKPEMSSFFEEAFDEGWAQKDVPMKVTIDIVVEGEAISVTLEELASLLQPSMKSALAPLAKYRRIPKTVLPKVDLVTPTRYLRGNKMAPLRALLPKLVQNCRAELPLLLEKLPQSKMDLLAHALTSYGNDTGTLTELMSVALEGEFVKVKNERGSIMRGSTFAVQMTKLFVLGSQFSEYRKTVLNEPLLQMANSASEPDLSACFRSVLTAIMSEGAVKSMPKELRHVCFLLFSMSEGAGLSADERDGQVAGLIMLRFFNPAIISPWTHDLLTGVAPSAALTGHLKLLTRALQKFSTGLAYVEESMMATQAVMTEMYPAFRTYLHSICEAMTDAKPDFSMPASDDACASMFEVLFSCGELARTKGWDDVAALVVDLRYLNKMQMYLQAEASYLSSLEKIEESLRKISVGTISTGDPFEIVYAALKQMSAWHGSLFFMLHDRLETEWLHVGSIADWMHQVLLEVDDVYQPYVSSFLFTFRNLVDISRDLSSSSEAAENKELIDAISRLFPLLGRPLKRFGETLAVVGDTQLTESHPDEKHVRVFMRRGMELFNALRDAVNVSAVLEMGQLQLQFVEKLDLIRPGRTIVRQGFLMDTVGAQLEMWLFSDMVLCGMQIPGSRNYKTVFKCPLSVVATRPVPGDELSFVLSTIADVGGGVNGGDDSKSSIRNRRLSMNKPVFHADFQLKCTTAKQKGGWLTDILGLQEKLQSSERLSRTSVAREQLPIMGGSDWGNLMKACVRREVAENDFVMQTGSKHGGRVSRIAEGKVALKCGSLELAKIGPGDVFCFEAFATELCVMDAVAIAGPVVIETIGDVDQIQDLQLLRRFFKSMTAMAEALLRKVRLRYAANRVLQAKQKRQLSIVEIGDLVLKALDEAEASATASSYSKLDVADILMGAEPVEFTTPLITDVLPNLLELKSYRAAAGSQLLRAHWTCVICALESEKHVTVKDGCPTLTRKGKTLNGTNVAKAIQDALDALEKEDFFGLKGETAIAQFAVTAKHLDRLYVSQHYLCLSGGRVLGLGAEKKQSIHMGHVSGCELKKKTLEVHYGTPVQSIKIAFKSTNEAATVFSLLMRRDMTVVSAGRTFDTFPTVTFPQGSVITSGDRPSVYVLQDVASVRVVAKMAAGDLLLETLGPGAMFVTDSAFFGLPNDAKVAWVSDPNSEVTAREISVEALGESDQLCVSVLKELVKVQVLEMQKYLVSLSTTTATST